jgi:hypothetical protein
VSDSLAGEPWQLGRTGGHSHRRSSLANFGSLHGTYEPPGRPECHPQFRKLSRPHHRTVSGNFFPLFAPSPPFPFFRIYNIGFHNSNGSCFGTHEDRFQCANAIRGGEFLTSRKGVMYMMRVFVCVRACVCVCVSVCICGCKGHVRVMAKRWRWKQCVHCLGTNVRTAVRSAP